MATQTVATDWTKALARARQLMANRTDYRFTATDAEYGTESLVLVTSATSEGTVYAVRVIDNHGQRRIRCTCPAHEHGKVCWHKGAALIRLGYTPQPGSPEMAA
jgi:hypothetical protein